MITSTKTSLLVVAFISSMLFLSSCSQEITFRNPALQAIRDSSTNVWLALDVKCYPTEIDDFVYYFIEANNNTENMSLRTTGIKKGTYPIGTSNSKTATFRTSFGPNPLEYTTGTGRGEGFVKITEYDSLNRTITGEFQFIAIKTSTDTIYPESVNFNRGVFHKVPVL